MAAASAGSTARASSGTVRTLLVVPVKGMAADAVEEIEIGPPDGRAVGERRFRMTVELGLWCDVVGGGRVAVGDSVVVGRGSGSER